MKKYIFKSKTLITAVILCALSLSSVKLFAGVQGALHGVFSVSTTRKVYFSQGNLQYLPQSKMWRLAENQYDICGDDNKSNIDARLGTYRNTGVWKDLYCYGTSGWNNGAGKKYMPVTSISNMENAPSDDLYLNKDLTGAYANADWGVYNAISNGGNQAGLWRTMTKDEWLYILNTRPNAASLYSVGTINSSVGLILLPDDWVLPSGLTFTPKGSSYESNVYTLAQWARMAGAGAVFLPAAGYCYCRPPGGYSDPQGVFVGETNEGYYQTTTYSADNSNSYQLRFSTSGCSVNIAKRCQGRSVRLVTDVPGYNVTWKNYDGSVLATTKVFEGETPTYSGNTPVKPATAQYSYAFAGWSPEVTAIEGDQTYTAQFVSIGNKYTIKFVNEDGIELQSTEVAYGEMPVYNGATPTKKADAQYTYTFARWSPEVITVTSAQTYTAQFSTTINKYRIVFQNEDGIELQSTEVAYGEMPVYNGATPIKETTTEYTYEFAGWLPIIKAATKDICYTTFFERNKVDAPKYTVNISGENCTLNISNEVPLGTTLHVEAVADECIQFDKWSDGNTDNPRTIVVTEDATYTAEFGKIQYTVKGKDATGGHVEVEK